MKTVIAGIFLIGLAFSSAHATQSEFCSVEIRKCGSSLSDEPVRCGYHQAVAFVNCGTGNVFQLGAMRNT